MRAILYAFVANFGIAVAKGVAAYFTGSGSMLAEAIHSLADCTNQLLLIVGLKRAQKPATPEHPLGFGKVAYFWSFIVAMMLFSMGGLFSIYEGVHKLNHPEGLKWPWVALLVLGFSILLETGSLMGALREINKFRGDRPLLKWMKESRRAEMVVIFGEDVAALVGLVVAFVFVAIAWATGNAMYDALGSISIGVILLVISVFLAGRIKALLIGRSADPDIEALIAQEMVANPQILKVFNVITVHFGPAVMLAAKIRLKPGMEIDAAARTINGLERRIREAFPEVKYQFIEPDVTD